MQSALNKALFRGPFANRASRSRSSNRGEKGGMGDSRRWSAQRPSPGRRSWFGHHRERFAGFRTRYGRELVSHEDLLDDYACAPRAVG
jgi:uncharacterized protein YeaO (DUF488 family)